MKKISVFPSLLISTVFVWGSMMELLTAAVVDSDRDGVNDYLEGKDGTDPNSASSFNPLSRGLLAYYPFDGSAKDESGNGLDGTVIGDLKATNGLGGPNSAYFFDGSNANIDVDSRVLLIGQNYSISTWFRTADHSKAPQTIFNTIPHTGIAIQHRAGALTGRFTFHIGNSVNSWDYAGGGVDQVNEPNDSWFHRVLVKEGTNYKMYVNGALQSQTNIPASAGYTAAVGYRFGSIGSSGFYDRETIKGTLDEGRIYTRALSSSDIAQLYAYELRGPDIDNDGLGDYQENQIGTDTNNPDTDGDGLKDGAEYLLADLGFDPLVNDAARVLSLFNDPNNASLFTKGQYEAFGGQRYTDGVNFVLTSLPSIEVFAPASTALKISLGGISNITTNSVPNGWLYNTSTKQMSGVMAGVTSFAGQLTGIKSPGLNLPVTFNFHPQNKQAIERIARVSSKKSSSPPFAVVPPTASSGLPVTLTVKSGPATISGNNIVTIIGVGTVVLAANQAGNNNFLPAPEITTSFKVTK